MATWQLLDHTADLAIEAHGPTPETALAALGNGLLAQLCDPALVQPSQRLAIGARGWDAAETLVTALGEILYRVSVGGWLFRKIEVEKVQDTEIRLVAHGEHRDPRRHGVPAEVKAATYHDLYFGPGPGGTGWRARVVFDV